MLKCPFFQAVILFATGALFSLFAGPVTNTVNEIDLIRAGQVDYYIAPQYDVHDPASEMFKLKDGVLIISGRVRWIKCDEGWKDLRSFRGKEDRDAPTGEWTRLEVIAKGAAK